MLKEEFVISYLEPLFEFHQPCIVEQTYEIVFFL